MLAEASLGKVEQSLTLNTSASWEASATYVNKASGTVTEVMHNAGEEISAGDLLYTVDLKPVIAAEGSIPMFRRLSEGVVGKDVEQLQRLLALTGDFEGKTNGIFDYRLQWAVRDWQKNLGIEETGMVDVGTLLFVPELPARASLSEDIKVGATVDHSILAVELLPESPDFSIELTEGHSRMVEPGMSVDINHGNGTWSAQITDIQTSEDGSSYTAHLMASEDETICGDECSLIPLGEPILLSSTIHIVPAMEGVTVPTSSIVTSVNGQTAVVSDTGKTILVTVIAGANGMVIVEGVDAGQIVRVPGEIPA